MSRNIHVFCFFFWFEFASGLYRGSFKLNYLVQSQEKGFRENESEYRDGVKKIDRSWWNDGRPSRNRWYMWHAGDTSNCKRGRRKVDEIPRESVLWQCKHRCWDASSVESRDDTRGVTNRSGTILARHARLSIAHSSRNVCLPPATVQSFQGKTSCLCWTLFLCLTHIPIDLMCWCTKITWVEEDSSGSICKTLNNTSDG